MFRVVTLCIVIAACAAPNASRPIIGAVVNPTAVWPSPPRTPTPSPRTMEAAPPAWLRPASTSQRRRVVTSTSITILDTITFVSGTASIEPKSLPMLDAIAATLDGNPSIRLMEVQVYSGPSSWQQARGEQRARNVRKYLIHKGVTPSRLRTEVIGAAPSDSPRFLIVQRD